MHAEKMGAEEVSDDYLLEDYFLFSPGLMMRRRRGAARRRNH